LIVIGEAKIIIQRNFAKIMGSQISDARAIELIEAIDDLRRAVERIAEAIEVR
tara:strand:+ start:203 stop:361 length:159 start_codon:yes stop_codon:yes gene_type:complete